MSIGDINSTEKGSAARYNTGKPDYSLIPLTVLKDAIYDEFHSTIPQEYYDAIELLGLFQETHDVGYLYKAFNLFDKDCTGVSKVLDSGRIKYAAWNWLKGMPWSACIASASRHMMKRIFQKELNDVESGLNHEWHYKCNILFLIQYTKSFKQGNDLPSKEYFTVDAGVGGKWIDDKLKDIHESLHNDWIEWKGGRCPVPEGTMVDVKYRLAGEKYHIPALITLKDGSNCATQPYWNNEDMANDIVAYRLSSAN